MTVRHAFRGYSIEQTVYWQSDRKRMEYRNSVDHRLGPHLAVITRCDLGQMFDLNLDSSQYDSAHYPPKPLTKEQMHAQGLDRQRISWSEKPMLHIEIKTVDTGERKQLFGRTARHVITARKEIPLEGSHSQPQETVQDGWYIDLNQQISCDPDYLQNAHAHFVRYSVLVAGVNQTSETQKMDKPEFVNIGEPERGFALKEITTSDNTYKSADGTMKHARSNDETIVTEFYEGHLDPVIFEVPHGFKRVREIERNPPVATLNPVQEFWERVKYTLSNWFTFE